MRVQDATFIQAGDGAIERLSLISLVSPLPHNSNFAVSELLRSGVMS